MTHFCFFEDKNVCYCVSTGKFSDAEWNKLFLWKQKNIVVFSHDDVKFYSLKRNANEPDITLQQVCKMFRACYKNKKKNQNYCGGTFNV